MTIAACFLSTEGAVLGADSTVTLPGLNGDRYFNNEQKVFEIGERSGLGLTLWGSMPIVISYRTLVADFATELARMPAHSVAQVADRWAQYAWARLRSAHSREIALTRSALDKISDGKPDDVTEEEKSASALVLKFETGFCIGGHCGSDRSPDAYQLEVDLVSDDPPQPQALPRGRLRFWGVPNMFRRVLHGVDWRVLDAILEAKRDDGTKLWVGTEDELNDLAFAHAVVVHPGLPIREAIDLVHFSIEATIKSLKFSHYAAPTCGGPIEIAVITSDRPFRWVRHKTFDSAI